MSTYDRITARILQTLEHGIVPWHQPWQESIPVNLVSGRPYRASMSELTVSCRVWLSRTGSLSTRTRLGAVSRRCQGDTVVSEVVRCRRRSERTDPRRVPLVRVHTVFNLEQTTGIETPVDSGQGRVFSRSNTVKV